MKQSKPPLVTRVRKLFDLRSLVGYLLGGGVWFWSGYILIVLLDGPLGEIFGASIGLFLANFIGNTVGFTLNFIILRKVAFKYTKQASLGVASTKYVVYTIINIYGLNYLILEVLNRQGIGPEIGQFIASGFFMFWNYFWYKFYIFKDVSKVKPKAKTRGRTVKRTTS